MKKSLISVVTAMTFVAAACGSSADNGAEPSSSDEASAGVSVDSSSAEPDQSAGDFVADPAGTLIVGNQYYPAHFDPDRATGSSSNVGLFPLFDRLIIPDDEGNLHPGLATEWGFTEDEMGFRIKLREDAVFHDGTPINADALQKNLERTMTLEGSTGADFLLAIESIEQVGEYEVLLHLNQTDSSLPFTFAEFPGMMISPASFDDPGMDLNPVGSGPWKFVETQTDSYTLYERFEDYWDPEAAQVQFIRMVAIPDSTARYNALRAGDVDIVPIAPQDADQAISQGFHVKSGPTTAVYGLSFNAGLSELDKLEARQAINYAIDREAIAEGVYRGYATPAQGFFPPDLPYSNEELYEGGYTYDPEKAKELLAAAGLADGFSMTANITDADSGGGIAIQDQLAQVGINLELQQAAGQQSTEAFYQGQSDALVREWGGRLNPVNTLTLTIGVASRSNPGGLTTAELDTLFEEAAQATDPDDHNEVVKAMSQEIFDSGLDINVVYPHKVIAYNDRVSDAPFVLWSSRAEMFNGIQVRAD